MHESANSPSADVTEIEVINTGHGRENFRAVIFDFDGTLSLVRRNWQDVMIPMMVDILAATNTPESRSVLGEVVEDFVMRLNGRQTIYQMMQLVEEVEKRGGQACTPIDYKNQYHDLLWEQVGERVESVRSGQVSADEMTVPESHQLLSRLRDAGMTLYLASGTDLKYVRDEVEVLGLTEFFGEHIYGALDDYEKFSKAMVIEQIIRESGATGDQLIGFGDGFVEIEEIKKVGGTAVGVASNETTRCGINAWKRDRLVQAGADIIVGCYRQQEQLLAMLGIH